MINEVEADAALATRFGEVDSPQNIFEHRSLSNIQSTEQYTNSSDSQLVLPLPAGVPRRHHLSELDVTLPKPELRTDYDIVLASTKVYNRVKDRDVDAITTNFTDRSHAWSLLSGISMAENSVIAVISLPLYEPELRQLRQLSTPIDLSTFDMLSKYPHLTEDFLRSYGMWWDDEGPPPSPSNIQRIKKEMERLSRNPPPMCAAAPMGDDLVRCL